MDGPKLALLTGAGPGAVAVVRVWGSGALDAVDSEFRPHRGVRLARTPAGRPRVGTLGVGVGDEVVALVVGGKAPGVEIQCHGGPAAIATVMEALGRRGVRTAAPDDWLRASSASTIRAEALADLPLATTVRTASHLLDQAVGALDLALEEIRRGLAGGPLPTIDRLAAGGEVGTRLVTGWRVVLAGRPNVGKSSLLNALVGFDRAIVDPTPGTTRDVVTAQTAFDGWPVELSDTAGLRPTDDPIESEGIRHARAAQDRADLVVIVLDRSRPLDDDDRSRFDASPDALVVANKVDLPSAWSGIGLPVSAGRGDGIADLMAAIVDRLVPAPPAPGVALPFRGTHRRRLDAIAAAVRLGDTRRAASLLDAWCEGRVESSDVSQ